MRVPKMITSTSRRHYSSISKSIYLSRCTDIFTNLALEDWLYKNMDFTNHHLLMLWRNEPCVVIGRHQNPWLECNFAALANIGQGVKLARRNSGGGTVYHDMNNLNMTFFTGRAEYSRKRNLELISRALKNGFSIDSKINKREDLCIGDCKISGTASKLGRTTAYHHCTLLVNANIKNISLALNNILGEHVKTNASVSVRSKIMNLSEIKPNISVDQVLDAIVKEYISIEASFDITRPSGVKIIETINDEAFPNVNEIRNMFLGSEWRFERTPKFTISRIIFEDPFGSNTVSAFLVVEKGKVSDVGIKTSDINLSINSNNLMDLRELFIAFMFKSFSKEILDEFDMVVLGLMNSEKCRNLVVSRCKCNAIM